MASTPATAAQKLILCEAVDLMLEDQMADAATDRELCKSAEIYVTDEGYGVNRLSGKVPFNSSDRSFQLTCNVSYRGLFNQDAYRGYVGHAVCE